MAKYTVELGEFVKRILANNGLPCERANFATAYPWLGLDAYPVYDESARGRINDRIITHYWRYELGAETPELFRIFMMDAMELVMPYYNQLYKSELLTVDYMLGKSFKEIHKLLEDVTGTSNVTTKGTSDSTANGTSRMLDTPQAQIGLLDDGYLTNASKTNDTSTTDTSGTTDSDSKRGTELVEETEHQETDPDKMDKLLTVGRQLLNIDRMLVEDEAVAGCFMLVW